VQYSHNDEKAKRFSEQALKRIAKDKLKPLPDIYALWYVYYSDMSPEIVRAVDILEANDQVVTSTRCQELYQRYLSNTQENNKVKTAGDAIQKTIEEVSGAVHGVSSATNKYKISLESINEEIKDDSSPQQVKSVLENVVHNTNEMLQENLKLEQELQKSTVLMQELRQDLETVKKQAMTDSLTGLANRKSFDVEMGRVIRESEKDGSAFCIIMMDIDHFKEFNDNYGHQVGDQVLRLVARTLIDNVKGRDVACRYGGEEFVIILPETNSNAGMMVADHLRNAVAGKDLVNRATNEKLGNITLSAGVAQHYIGEAVDDIIARCDEALYKAKNDGRNCVREAKKFEPPKEIEKS